VSATSAENDSESTTVDGLTRPETQAIVHRDDDPPNRFSFVEVPPVGNPTAVAVWRLSELNFGDIRRSAQRTDSVAFRERLATPTTLVVDRWLLGRVATDPDDAE